MILNLITFSLLRVPCIPWFLTNQNDQVRIYTSVLFVVFIILILSKHDDTFRSGYNLNFVSKGDQKKQTQSARCNPGFVCFGTPLGFIFN